MLPGFPLIIDIIPINGPLPDQKSPRFTIKLRPSPMPYLNFDGLQIAYHEQGSGQPVLLVHCSGDSHRQWQFVDKLLPDCRLIAPDLIGYGVSDPWPEGQPMPADTDARMLDELMQQIDQPIHVIAHSYGAASLLNAVARQIRDRRLQVISLFLIEPVCFNLLDQPTHQSQWQQIVAMQQRSRAYAQAGDLDRVADLFMGFWLGDQVWQQMPHGYRQAVISTMPKVAQEFNALDQAADIRPELGQITCPVSLLRGEHSPQPARIVAELLAEMIPGAQLADMAGAGHMIPQTRPEELSQLILRFRQNYW